MAVVRDHRMRQTNPNHFKYLVNELLDFIKEFEMGEFYRKKVLDHLNHAATHYAIKMRADGSSITPEQIKADPTSLAAAYDYCAEQVEALLVELLRYQQWSAQPLQPDA